MNPEEIQRKYESTIALTKQLADQLRKIQEPLDFDALERDGVIVREGKSFYAPKPGSLPDHVSVKISSIRYRNGKAYVTFMRSGTTKIDKIVKQLEKKGY